MTAVSSNRWLDSCTTFSDGQLSMAAARADAQRLAKRCDDGERALAAQRVAHEGELAALRAELATERRQRKDLARRFEALEQQRALPA